jgi:vacuolar-type H+-ATPase subunit H
MSESIQKILMERDDMTKEEANELIKEAKKAFDEYLSFGDHEAAYNICEEYFGLEPDYLFQIMGQ